MTGRICVCICLAAVLSFSAVEAQTVSGRVYNDVNRDGKFDRGDKPLRGVRITDGVGFTATNAKGIYRLSVSKDPVLVDGGAQSVAISLPSGYRPVGQWFHNLGEADSVKGADFGLVRQKQTLPFRFIHGTDCHVPRGGPEKFIGFRADVAAMADKLALCVITGDLVDLSDSHPLEKGKAEFDFFVEHAKNFPVPLYCVPGNHDIMGVRDKDPNRPHDSESYAYGSFTRRIGPLRWSFNYAGIHFVGLDFNHKTDKGWEWGIPPSAIKWLDKDLEGLDKGTRILLFVHTPTDRALLEPVLAKYGVECVFQGHDHQERTYSIGKTPVISSGSISQIFNDKDRVTGYRIVRVSRDGIDTFYRATGSKHAIDLDYPRWNSKIKDGDVLSGSFYDPQGKIERLTIRVGKDGHNVYFDRGPVCCRFTMPLDVPDAASVEIETTVTDGQDSWSIKRTYNIAKKQ